MSVYERNSTNGVWGFESEISPELGEPSGIFGASVLLNEHYAIVGDPGLFQDAGDDGSQTSGQQVHIFSRDVLDRWTESGVIADPGPWVGNYSRLSPTV